MALSEDQVVQEILTHIKKCGGAYQNWYVGIATDPEERLFSDHNVNKATDAWIHRTTHSENGARNAEEKLLAYGMDGGKGGGDESTKSVYAYKKNSHTKP